MSTPSKYIIDKLKKLIAMQDTTNGCTAGEAANAAAIIQNILTKYSLNIDELNLSDEDINEEYGSDIFKLHANKKSVNWHRLLYSALARANNCRAFIMNEGGVSGKLTMKIIGQQRNVQIVNYFYEYLINTIDAMSLRAAFKSRIVKAQIMWRISFSNGCVMAITERLKMDRRQLIGTIKETENYALVVTQNNNLKEAISKILGRTRTVSIPIKDNSAFQQGKIAGSTININGNTDRTKQIGE